MSASVCEHTRLRGRLLQVFYEQSLPERWEGGTGNVPSLRNQERPAWSGVDRSDTVLCLGSYQCHSTSSYPEKILALPWKSSFHDFPVTFVSNVKTKEVFDNWNYVCLFDSALYEPCSSGVGLK